MIIKDRQGCRREDTSVKTAKEDKQELKPEETHTKS